MQIDKANMTHPRYKILQSLVLVAACSVLATSASAFAIHISSDQVGQELEVGDLITVTVTADFDPGTIIWSTGISFDDSRLTYLREESSSIGGAGYGYALYIRADQPYLVSAGDTEGDLCWGYTVGAPTNGDGCSLWPSPPPSAVWINALTSAGVIPGDPIPAFGNGILMAELTFQASADGETTVAILFDGSIGSAIVYDDGTTTKLATPTLGEDLSFTIPEPRKSWLSAAALLCIAALMQRRRQPAPARSGVSKQRI